MEKDNPTYIYAIALFFLFSCYCCTPGKVSDPMLLRADSLMECRPDSALRLLQRIDQPHKMQKAERAFYALLLTQAEGMSGEGHTSDSLINVAFDYYQQHGTAQQKIEAWYYRASVYRDLGDAPRAIDYFKQAADAAERKTEYPLLSRIYNQLGTLFFYQNLPKEGVAAYQQAYGYALLANDSARLAYSSLAMARAYTELDHSDSTLYYYKETATLAQRLGNTKLEEAARSELADIYLQLGEVEEARRLLEHLAQSGVDLLIWGELYEKCGKADSARYAYRKALERGNIYVKKGVSEGLYRLAKVEGKTSEALNYLEQTTLYKDSIQEITDTEGVKRVESLYAYQHITNENNRLSAVNKNKERILLWMGIALLATLLLLGYAWKRTKEQKEHAARLNQLEKQEYRKKLADYDAEIASLKQRLDRASAIGEQEKERVRQLLEKTIEEKNKLTESRQEAKTEFRASRIYRHIHHTDKNAKFKMTDDDWSELQQELNKAYNDFTRRLYIAYPKLSKTELRVCLLVKAEVTNSDIAALLCLSANSVSSIRARLFEKIHHKKGKAKDFDNYIRGL